MKNRKLRGKKKYKQESKGGRQTDNMSSSDNKKRNHKLYEPFHLCI